MAKLEKKRTKLRDADYKNVGASTRQHDQSFQTQVVKARAANIMKRLEQPDKRIRYNKDMELLDQVGKEYRGEVAYSLLGNKKLKIDKEGELTRERSRLRAFRGVERKKKVQKRDSDGNLYIGRLEKDNRFRISSYDFDAKGELIAKSARDKDGRFEEKWERDENGELIRTKYSTSRFRDVGFRSPVSEEMSGSFERAGKQYRTLTRQRGARKNVFERDEKGNLELVGRESRNHSKYIAKAEDGKTSKTDIRHRGKFGKSYQSRLDPEGNEIGRDITSIRRLWNKRSADYHPETGRMTRAKHTFGKFYKSETQFDETHKYTTRKILGLRLLPAKLKALSQREVEANADRADIALQHEDAWKDAIVVHRPPSPGITRQLGKDSRGTAPTQRGVEASGLQNTATPKDEEIAFPNGDKPSGTRPPSRQSSTKSSSDSSITLANDSSQKNSESRSSSAAPRTADPKASAILAGFKRLTLNEASKKESPSRQSSASSVSSTALGDGSRGGKQGEDAAVKRGYHQRDVDALSLDGW